MERFADLDRVLSDPAENAPRHARECCRVQIAIRRATIGWCLLP
jgi:hypothetical protein